MSERAFCDGCFRASLALQNECDLLSEALRVAREEIVRARAGEPTPETMRLGAGPLAREQVSAIERRIRYEGYAPNQIEVLRLIESVRVAERVAARAQENAIERERLANESADRDLDRRLEAERQRDEMRRERDEALSKVPRLKDEIRSLHRELGR